MAWTVLLFLVLLCFFVFYLFILFFFWYISVVLNRNYNLELVGGLFNFF